jgi:two-component sensor histidine kinase
VTDFLVRRIAGPPRPLIGRIGVGLGLAALTVGVRLALVPYLGFGTPFVAFMPAVLLATVLGGGVGGAVCAGLLALASPLLLTPQAFDLALRRLVLGEILFLASSAFVIWIVTILRSALTREMAAREAENLLRLELQHRVKNTLAVVQALADQTFRSAPDPRTARAAFTERLIALARVHDVLVEGAWQAVALDVLAERALAPFRSAPSERLRIEGPPVSIPPGPAVSLALCLHELATNASKHGALSTEAGSVRLTWRIEPRAAQRSRLVLDWVETGGPTPRASSVAVHEGRSGFGTRLLTRALDAQPGGQAQLSLPPEGARWSAAFDL